MAKSRAQELYEAGPPNDAAVEEAKRQADEARRKLAEAEAKRG